MCRGLRAPVNKIIPCSYVDGPGNRSAVFFQGCDFHCRYCHNPETIKLCSDCGNCVDHCPSKALSVIRGKVTWDPARCCSCDTCIQVCEFYSTPRIRRMTVDEVIGELRTALPFITGITVSGGECTGQYEYLAELFQKIHLLGKTAFVDTNGQRDFEEMPLLMETMDQAMLDIKSYDPEEHRMLTGYSNKIVLKNAAYLAEAGKLYEVRTVIVPGLLDCEKTVKAVGNLLSKYPEVRYKLIRYRPWGVKPPLAVETPDDNLMERLSQIAFGCGVREVIVT